MRKVLLLASCACFAALNASAFEFNPYVGAKAKYVFARNEVKVKGSFEGKEKLNDNILGGSVVVGTTYPLLDGNFRFELEYTKNADAKKRQVKVKTQGVLFNVYYDFDLKTVPAFKPYIGAGLGWGRTEIESKNSKTIKNNGTSAQIGGGINYQICEHVTADLGYRYITYGDFDKEYHFGPIYEKDEFKPHAHEILLGVRYSF